jgi:PAS domain S-box-containing protein
LMETGAESIHVVASPQESATTLRAIIEMIRSLMQADVASILGIALDQETVGWKAAAGFRSPEIDYEQSMHRPHSISLVLQALAENRVVVFEGAGSTADLPLYVAEGVEYLAVAPIRISGNRSGVVTAGFRTAHNFTENEQRLLQDLAEMASLTLDNARLQELAGESEARLRLAELFAHIGTFEWNIKNGVNTWSPELEEIYGVSMGGEAGAETVWADLVHSDDRANVIAYMLKAFETHQPVEGEWRVIWPDGSIHWLLGRFQLFEDDAGRPTRLTGINLDITDRKRAEDAARESEARAQQSRMMWEKTFDAIGEGILVYDQQQKIVRCNTTAAEMIATGSGSVVGQSFPEAFARTFGKTAADLYLAEDRDTSKAAEIRTADDRRFLVSMFPINEQHGGGFNVVTWKDVTRIAEIQEQLARSQRLAAIGQLSAGVAHEVNNPLATITTCAEGMIRDMRDEESRKFAAAKRWDVYAEEIVRQSLRCKQITRGLLDLTRQRQPQRAMCDINALVRDCARVAAMRDGINVDFQTHLDESVGNVATDAGMVRQILVNLLGNAIDAIGNADKHGQIAVSTKRGPDRLLIEIADTGGGISPDVLAKVFDPFFSTKKKTGKGYGLGLSISLSLAESLGGGLSVESKAEQGSKFRLWLPLPGLE